MKITKQQLRQLIRESMEDIAADEGKITLTLTVSERSLQELLNRAKRGDEAGLSKLLQKLSNALTDYRDAHRSPAEPEETDDYEDEEDAEHQHAQDHRIQRRRIQEYPDQIVVQQPADGCHNHQEEQHADEIGKRAAHWIVSWLRAMADQPPGVRTSTRSLPGPRVSDAKAPTSMRAFTPWSIR